jgi:hypothetical protein
MQRILIASIFCFVMAQGAALGQWTCDAAAPIDLPHEQSWLETMGPESWGYWQRFTLDRPAVVEITGTPCSAPGSARVRLWSECSGGNPDGLIGAYETPVFDLGGPAFAEVALNPGEYFLEFKTLCVLDWDTWFWGTLRIRARDTIDIDVLSNVNPRSRGVVPVAILGSEIFDVSDVDVTTLRFGPGEARTKHDLTDPWTFNAHLRDVNLDGRPDLVAHFPVQETGIACARAAVWLTVEGLAGQSISGTGLVRTVGCAAKKSNARSPIFNTGS